MERLVASIRKSGAVEESMAEAGRFAEAAVSRLDLFPACAEREALENLARYTVARNL
jgi:geranylgeranyl pyrophosphate synthase